MLLVAASAGAQPKCTFKAGALPAETLPARAPHGSKIPIEHVIVLMQENRSADHYFGMLKRQGQARFEPEPKKASNPDPTNPSGPPIKAFHQTRICEVGDLDHSWSGTHREWNHGMMDGFTAANVHPDDPTGSRAMGFYDKRDLPFYYKLYARFATGDHFFSSALTQTFPNRFYLLAGTSFGEIRNNIPDLSGPDYTQRSIFNLLDEAQPPVSWKIYFSDLPFGGIFGYVRTHGAANLVTADPNFFNDAANGTLPAVSFVDPRFLGTPNVESDEHPPSNVQVGQEFVSRIVKALMASPLWNKSALFITYDEHGGYFDHVPPPQACVPDDIPPDLESGDEQGAFDNYGIRVPVVVVSAFAKRHFVSRKVYDHTSILRFIETRFDLPALTARDANADAMLDFFRFKKPRKPGPPLPNATIDPARAAQCGTSVNGALVFESF
jgi:phospholipase C